jgi:hypothetical protein
MNNGAIQAVDQGGRCKRMVAKSATMMNSRSKSFEVWQWTS